RSLLDTLCKGTVRRAPTDQTIELHTLSRHHAEVIVEETCERSAQFGTLSRLTLDVTGREHHHIAHHVVFSHFPFFHHGFRSHLLHHFAFSHLPFLHHHHGVQQGGVLAFLEGADIHHRGVTEIVLRDIQQGNQGGIADDHPRVVLSRSWDSERNHQKQN